MHFLYTAPRYHTNQHFAVKALLDAGHEVSFFALTRGQSEEYDALTPTVLGFSPTYETVLHGIERCKRLVGLTPDVESLTKKIPPVREFWNEMRRRRPFVMIIRDPLTTYGRLSVLAAKILGVRLILYTQMPKHHPLKRKLKRWRKILTSIILWATRAEWITPVLGAPDRYRSVDSWHYVPFVMEPQTSPQEKSWFIGDEIHILAVGKFQLRKNHRLFLQVIHRLSKRYSIRSTIIGECGTPDQKRELEDLKQYSESLKLNDKVEFKVNLSFSEVQEQYRRHDLFVLASRREPAAISPLEAMAHSLPVVCSDSNGTKCYIRPGENGFVFHTDDPCDLEACMDRILKNRAELVKMGNRSYELVVAEHAPKRYVDALVSIAESHD